MFSGAYDQMTMTERIEENGLPNVGEFDMLHGGDLGFLHKKLKKVFKKTYKKTFKKVKFSSVANVAIGAAAGYAKGGYTGAAVGAIGGYAASKQKSESTGGSFPTFQPQIQIGPDGQVMQTYDPLQPNYIGPPMRVGIFGGSFLDNNPWVLYAGGGLIAVIAITQLRKK